MAAGTGKPDRTERSKEVHEHLQDTAHDQLTVATMSWTDTGDRVHHRAPMEEGPSML